MSQPDKHASGAMARESEARAWLRQDATVYTLKPYDGSGRPARGFEMVNENWFTVQGPNAAEIAAEIHAVLSAISAPEAQREEGLITIPCADYGRLMNCESQVADPDFLNRVCAEASAYRTRALRAEEALDALRSEPQREGLAGRLADLSAAPTFADAIDPNAEHNRRQSPWASCEEVIRAAAMASLRYAMKEGKATDLATEIARNAEMVLATREHSALALHATSQPPAYDCRVPGNLRELEEEIGLAIWASEPERYKGAAGAELAAEIMPLVTRAFARAPSQPLPQEGGRVPDEATKDAMLDAGYAVIQREPRLLAAGFLIGHVAQIYDAMQAMVVAAPQPPLPSGAPDALAKLRKALLVELEKPSTDRVPRPVLADRLLAIIRAAIAQAEAGTSGTSEPFAWFTTDVNGKPVAFVQHRFDADFLREHGHTLTPVYRAAPSLQPSRQGVEAMRDLPWQVLDAMQSAYDEAEADWKTRSGLRVTVSTWWPKVFDAMRAALAQPQGAGPSERGA